MSVPWKRVGIGSAVESHEVGTDPTLCPVSGSVSVTM
jgi:hypothetical protein